MTMDKNLRYFNVFIRECMPCHPTINMNTSQNRRRRLFKMGLALLQVERYEKAVTMILEATEGCQDRIEMDNTENKVASTDNAGAIPATE